VVNQGLLFYPKYRSAVAAWRKTSPGKALPLAVVTLLFWALTYNLFHRMLVYFRSTEDIGTLLTVKLVSMTLISFLLILMVSNLISAFNTFFFSEDLYLLVSSPVSLHRIYLARFFETMAHASWMVMLMAVPIFAALGRVFDAGWKFYAGSLLTVIPLAMIPTAIGVIIAMLLVNLFVARRTRDILSFLSVAALGAMLIAFRLLNPEKALISHEMDSVISFFNLLRSPDSALSPHFWSSRVLLDLLGLGRGDGLFFALVLASVALGCMSIGYYVTVLCYRRGFSRAQEAQISRIAGRGWIDRLLDLYLRPLHSQARELVIKDLKAFARDKSQWSQLFLLGGMIAVYLYNFSVLPLESSPVPRYFLQVVLNFLNLGLAGFVIASIATRFVFPGVSLEGGSFWLLISAPVSLKRFLWAKMFVLTVPLVVLGQFLVFFSSRILDSDNGITTMACFVVFSLTLAIVALGTGMGAIYPRFEVENPAQISTGIGGVLYMIASLAVIGVTIALLMRPIHHMLMSRIHEISLRADQWGEVIGFCVLIAGFHALVVKLSMARGVRVLSRMEF
jgi:ABC-2 type transport system permease protein